MARIRFLKRLGSEEKAVSAVEFALIAPVFCTLLLGTLDAGHALYMQSVLQGVMQRAGRASSLESSTATVQQTVIDQMVKDNVATLVNNATVTMKRRYFRNYSTAAQAIAEPYTDSNSNGTCDQGEPYQDNNVNNVWDADGGDEGQGGARDTVVYTADVSYPRLFPLATLIGLPANTHLKATTVLVNQPYGDQSSYSAPVARNCT